MARFRHMSDMKRYPALVSMLQRRLPNLRAKNKRAFRAFARFCGLSEDRAERLLWYPHGPPIKMHPQAQVRGYAEMTFDEINVRKLFADQFEAAVAGGSSVQQVKLLMESKLLHETVHWVFGWLRGKPEPKYPGKDDHGWAFERAAYGKDITATSLGIRNIIRIPGNE